MGTSLAAISFPGWSCCSDSSLGTTSEKARPPQASLPYPSPGSLQLSHRKKGPTPPFTKRQWIPDAFLRGLHIDSADVSRTHPLRVPRCSSGRPLPFQEAIPDCAIILGTLVLLREAERRGGKRRERKPERGRERKEGKRQ